jgi:DNA-binding CsgD family transcriptional regulator
MNEIDESRLTALLEALCAHDWKLFERVAERLVARRRGPRAPSPGAGVETLTERERQIVEQAMLGRTNKEIAYTLGISDSTVRVLMARAARRLGAQSRRELLARAAEPTRPASSFCVAGSHQVLLRSTCVGSLPAHSPPASFTISVPASPPTQIRFASSANPLRSLALPTAPPTCAHVKPASVVRSTSPLDESKS